MVTADSQLLWTDGRYWAQASLELDCNWWLMRSDEPGVLSLTAWLTTNMQSGQVIAADPKLIPTGKVMKVNVGCWVVPAGDNLAIIKWFRKLARLRHCMYLCKGIGIINVYGMANDTLL